VRSIDHEAPHYEVFSTPLLPRSSSSSLSFTNLENGRSWVQPYLHRLYMTSQCAKEQFYLFLLLGPQSGLCRKVLSPKIIYMSHPLNLVFLTIFGEENKSLYNFLQPLVTVTIWHLYCQNVT
jgi:hypothetical protein